MYCLPEPPGIYFILEVLTLLVIQYLTQLVSLLKPPSYSVEFSNSLKSNSFSPQMSISSSWGVNIIWRGLSLVTRLKPLWKAKNCFSTLLNKPMKRLTQVPIVYLLRRKSAYRSTYSLLFDWFTMISAPPSFKSVVIKDLRMQSCGWFEKISDKIFYPNRSVYEIWKGCMKMSSMSSPEYSRRSFSPFQTDCLNSFKSSNTPFFPSSFL